MSKQELTSLLQKYLSREITPAEKQALALLIAQSADEEQLKESVEDLWDQYQPTEQLSGQASEMYYQQIMQQIKPAQVVSPLVAEPVQEVAPHVAATAQDAAPLVAETAPETTGAKPMATVHRVHFLRRSWGRVAAAAVLILTVAGILYTMLPAKEVQPPSHAGTAILAKRVLTHHITLPDGSKVILQDSSTLDYPTAFTGNTREVTLTGEAYFDVAHNAAQPFIIHSGKVKTTVLGTAFNIKAWPAEEEVTVTVTRGKVKVEDGAHLLGIITPDQQISFNNRNEQAKQASVNASEEASWKDKEYTMEDIPLDEAITEIQMRYGTLIEVSNREAAEQCPFTASFKQGESLDYILNVICKIYKASWRKEEGRIIIDNVQCN